MCFWKFEVLHRSEIDHLWDLKNGKLGLSWKFVFEKFSFLFHTYNKHARADNTWESLGLVEPILSASRFFHTLWRIYAMRIDSLLHLYSGFHGGFVYDIWLWHVHRMNKESVKKAKMRYLLSLRHRQKYQIALMPGKRWDLEQGVQNEMK